MSLTEQDLANLARRMTELHLPVTMGDIGDYYEAFHEFDRDNSGNISTSELGQVMRSLGENPTGMELEVKIDTLQSIQREVTKGNLCNKGLLLRSRLRDKNQIPSEMAFHVRSLKWLL